MKKILLISALLITPVFSHAQSRFGEIRTDVQAGANQAPSLTIGGKLVHPIVSGNNSLQVVKIFQDGDKDILVSESEGGTFCPALYNVTAVSKDGTVPTKFFGTCSDLVNISHEGKKTIIKVHGFNNKPDTTYIYESGSLFENGKRIAPFCGKECFGF
mgnify:FL=1